LLRVFIRPRPVSTGPWPTIFIFMWRTHACCTRKDRLKRQKYPSNNATLHQKKNRKKTSFQPKIRILLDNLKTSQSNDPVITRTPDTLLSFFSHSLQRSTNIKFCNSWKQTWKQSWLLTLSSVYKQTRSKHRRSQERHGPSKFLEKLVILCFERQCSKQNTAVRLKSRHLAPQIFWAGYATGSKTRTNSTAHALLTQALNIGVAIVTVCAIAAGSSAEAFSAQALSGELWTRRTRDGDKENIWNYGQLGKINSFWIKWPSLVLEKLL